MTVMVDTSAVAPVTPMGILCSAPSPAWSQKFAPKVGAERLRRAADPDAEQDEPEQPGNLGGGEDDLHEGSGFDSEDVDD